MRPTEHFALAKIFSVRGALLLALGCCLPESDSPAQPAHVPTQIASSSTHLRPLVVEVGMSHGHNWPTPTKPRILGEFERQDALLIACNELLDDHPELFAEIVRHTHETVPVIALVSDGDQAANARQLLETTMSPFGHVRFAEIPHDTMWIRDYGPMILSASRKAAPILLDAGYNLDRREDDRVPARLAPLLGIRRVAVPFPVEGGNLLSNGQGLGISTQVLLDPELVPDAARRPAIKRIARLYGFEQLVLLEPLEGEPTGHIDMFAAFVSETAVVVGSYTPAQDPHNAAVLDRNADLLASITTRRGRLRVVRVPMPSHDDGVWRTHTNVVFANGVLLMPIYPGRDAAGRAHAMAAFGDELPGWHIVGIDASRIIESHGALHCMCMNLGGLGRLPELPQPQAHPRAVRHAQPSEAF